MSNSLFSQLHDKGQYITLLGELNGCLTQALLNLCRIRLERASLPLPPQEKLENSLTVQDQGTILNNTVSFCGLCLVE